MLTSRHVRSLRPTPLYALVIFVVGLVYRLAWVYQGFSATDEGWLQAQGARIAQGQVPYRDFDYLLPPLTSYKEAALFVFLGDHWTVFASRTLFAVEVSVAPVLVFFILRRFVSDRAAFLATLPAIFFTVSIAGFTSYTIDGQFMALLSILLAVYANGRRAVGVGAGIAAVLALMSKQPFLAFVVALPFAALAGSLLRRRAGRPVPPRAIASLVSSVPWYVAGAVAASAAILGYFAAAGVAREFVEEGFFVLTTQSNPTSLRFKLIQDLPEYLTQYGALGPALLALIAILLCFRLSRVFEVVRTALLLAILGLVFYASFRHPPPVARPLFLIVAYGVLSGTGIVALVASVFWESASPLPPEIVFLGLVLQWVAQFHAGGLVFWFEGAYLSLPMALLFLHAMSKVRVPVPRTPLRLGAPTVAALLLGAWLAAGGLAIVVERPYQDAPRKLLTADFSTQALHGITTYPLTAQRFDALVAEIDKRTQPGDPIYVLPDFAILYEATGRRNPTRFDWPDEPFLTPDLVNRVVADLRRDPPKVVFLLNQREGAYVRNQPPIDWANSRWAPIYDYITAHYRQDGSVQDIRVLVPSSS